MMGHSAGESPIITEPGRSMVDTQGLDSLPGRASLQDGRGPSVVELAP